MHRYCFIPQRTIEWEDLHFCPLNSTAALSSVLSDRTISIPCSHFLQCGIIINSHLGVGCFPHQWMQWRFIATISKRVCVCVVGWRRWWRGSREIVHIHHKLLGSYCLALRVCWGGWDKQWMTNVKWVSGNLLRKGQVSRLCCTLQYVLWTVEEAQLCTMSLGAGKPGLKILDQMSQYKGFVLILCFPSSYRVFLFTSWLPDATSCSASPLPPRLGDLSAFYSGAFSCVFSKCSSCLLLFITESIFSSCKNIDLLAVFWA